MNISQYYNYQTLLFISVLLDVIAFAVLVWMLRSARKEKKYYQQRLEEVKSRLTNQVKQNDELNRAHWVQGRRATRLLAYANQEIYNLRSAISFYRDKGNPYIKMMEYYGEEATDDSDEIRNDFEGVDPWDINKPYLL